MQIIKEKLDIDETLNKRINKQNVCPYKRHLLYRPQRTRRNC